MPGYKSNVQEVLGNLKRQLENIKGPVLDKITRTIGTTLVASNVRRIHNDGKAVDGIGNRRIQETRLTGKRE
jgi:hypothetical protein